MILLLTNLKIIIFADYSYGYPLDLYVVISPIRGAGGGDKFWMQPFGDGSLGFIQPTGIAIA
jgi:hypothetical protein